MPLAYWATVTTPSTTLTRRTVEGGEIRDRGQEVTSSSRARLTCTPCRFALLTRLSILVVGCGWFGCGCPGSRWYGGTGTAHSHYRHTCKVKWRHPVALLHIQRWRRQQWGQQMQHIRTLSQAARNCIGSFFWGGGGGLVGGASPIAPALRNNPTGKILPSKPSMYNGVGGGGGCGIAQRSAVVGTRTWQIWPWLQ